MEKLVTKHEKLKWAAEQKLVEKLINKIVDNDIDAEELSQEIYLILLEKEDEVIERMTYKDLRNFIITIARNNYFSSNSPFFTKHKRYSNNKCNVTFDVDSETGDIVYLKNSDDE